jgi:hypothetical protein
MTHGNNAPPLSSAWSAQETDACFIVRDANGQALAYVHFEQEPGTTISRQALTRERGGSPQTSPSCPSC